MMPVIATPVSCSDQPVLVPQTTTVFGCQVKARRKAVEAVQGQTLTIDWQFTDPDGRIVDLTSCGTFSPGDATTGSVRLKTGETVNAPRSGNDVSVDVVGTVTSLTTGQATFALPTNATSKAGIYLVEAAVFNVSGNLIFVNQFYLVVNRGLYGGDPCQISGMPSIAEIRLHLRDSDGSDNPLLETVQFDMAEIAAAIEYPVLYWNEAPPPICQNYTTTTFPYRYNWLNAIVSRLYATAAHFYRRNRLQFQAQGGIGVDDLNKAKEYDAKAIELWEDYRKFVQWTKVRANAEGAIQTSGGWGTRTGWW